MEKIFIDTNFAIEFLKGNKKVVKFFEKNFDKFVSNILVYLEMLHVLQKLKTKYPQISLKIAEDFIDSILILPVDLIPLKLIREVMEKFDLKSNDALIAATCKYYDITKIATLDKDFEKVDFLEVVKV